MNYELIVLINLILSDEYDPALGIDIATKCFERTKNCSRDWTASVWEDNVG